MSGKFLFWYAVILVALIIAITVYVQFHGPITFRIHIGAFKASLTIGHNP